MCLKSLFENSGGAALLPIWPPRQAPSERRTGGTAEIGNEPGGQIGAARRVERRTPARAQSGQVGTGWPPGLRAKPWFWRAAGRKTGIHFCWPRAEASKGSPIRPGIGFALLLLSGCSPLNAASIGILKQALTPADVR